MRKTFIVAALFAIASSTAAETAGANTDMSSMDKSDMSHDNHDSHDEHEESDWTKIYFDFGECDSDDGSTITREEFAGCMRGQRVNGHQQTNLFTAYDLNGDEKISDSEYAKVQARSQAGPDWGAVTESVDAHDVMWNWLKQDGSDTVSWEDFLSSWMVVYPHVSYQKLGLYWDLVDQESAGVITEAQSRQSEEDIARFKRRFATVDREPADGRLSPEEWNINPTFVGERPTDTLIRERFGYYDANGDGAVDFDELYLTIASKNLAWARFQSLWATLDVNRSGFIDAKELDEALNDDDTTDWERYHLDELIALFDQNKDGKVNMVEMWLVKSQFWDLEKDQTVAREEYRQDFYDTWFNHDTNYDWSVTWEEFQAARAFLPSSLNEQAWAHYSRQTDPNADQAPSVDFEDVMTIVQGDDQLRKELDLYWSILDQDYDGVITKDDLYSAVGIIAGLVEEDVDDIWADLTEDGQEVGTFDQACNWKMESASFTCAFDWKEIAAYAEHRSDTEDFFAAFDTDNDQQLTSAELSVAFEDLPESVISELLAWHDTNNDDMVSVEERLLQGWIE